MRQPEQGFLCWSASADRILIHDTDDQRGHEIFQLLPQRPFTVEEHVDWTTQRLRYTDPQSGQPIGETIHSLLFPGALFHWRTDHFAWWNYDMGHGTVAYMSAKGYRVIGPRECNFPTFDAIDEDAFAAPWILVWLAGNNPLPLLLLFENPPIRVETLARSQGLKFDGPAGLIAVCPLAGCDRWLPQQRAALAKGLDDRTRAMIETWSRLRLAAPIGCHETIRVDRQRSRIDVCQKFEYLETTDAFGTQALKIAPLPPLLAMAHQAQVDGAKLGFEVDGEVIDPRIPTLFGPYVGVAGDEARFSMPRSAGIDQTIAPVRVTGDPRCDDLQNKLDAELGEPTLTFGGDHSYDPNNIQDICHNLRVLGWATWSLDESARQRRFAGLARELKGLEPDSYELETEPVTGLTYRWEKHIWGGGAIAVDLEWYNGMQLAGLSLGVFYSADEGAWLKRISQQWPIVKDLLRYFEIFHDWATGLTFTALTRKSLWFDGLNFAWQGQAGAARLAQAVGDHETADRAEYLAARSSIGRAAAWFMYDYAMAHHASPYPKGTSGDGDVFRTQGDEAVGHMTVGGFLERRGVTVGTPYSPGNAIGYLVPEQLLLQRFNDNILAMMRRGQYALLEKDMADWSYRYVVAPDGRGPTQKYSLYPSHMHFYYLDPQLFVRSILLREPLEKLLGYTTELSGPVMECFLVASAPMVVFPMTAKFRGVQYDARSRRLTIRFSADADRDLQFVIVSETGPSAAEGADDWTYDAQSQMAKLTVTADGESCQQLSVTY